MEWHIYIDGASSGNPGESGAGVIGFDNEGKEVVKESTYLGTMTNNMAEYEALLIALKTAISHKIRNISVYSDSQLVVRQVSGQYRVKDSKLKKYIELVKILTGKFDNFTLQYIPREENRFADKLAKNAVAKKG